MTAPTLDLQLEMPADLLPLVRHDLAATLRGLGCYCAARLVPTAADSALWTDIACDAHRAMGRDHYAAKAARGAAEALARGHVERAATLLAEARDAVSDVSVATWVEQVTLEMAGASC